MNGDHGTVPAPERARDSSWGGPGVRAELRRIADDAARRAGFRVCEIEVLRGDGLLELVAITGAPHAASTPGSSHTLSPVWQVLQEGTRYGDFVFLAEEDMDAHLQEAIGSYGYVPPALELPDPDRWRPLDMLVAPLTDGSGRTRALLHLDEPLSGHRPRAEQLLDISTHLELVLQAVLATVDRDELTRRARLDETARAIVRAASERLGAGELLARVQPELVAGFRARSVALMLDEPPDEPGKAPASSAQLPASLRPAVEAATRRAWQSRTVIIADPGRVWGDDSLEQEHLQDLTDHLLAHDARELLLVPVGAGHESTGVLVVVRDDQEDRWTEGESQAALGVGHDLGRALLSTRAHEREQQLIDQLQRLDEYRQQLIATVSHELKNPLGLIVGHVEMLEAVPGLPKAAATSVHALGRGTSRLTSLVDNLLLLSRISNPDIPVVGLPVDLGSVLTQVVEDESLRAERQGVTLRTSVSDASCRVTGEPEELRQVIANLVSNAVKYSRTGGSVTLCLEQRGDEVVFTCADNGLGISEEDREHLFTEFFRSTNAEALQRPGTGLGLAIVWRIVSRHGGRTEVETQLGHGTTFRVALPAAGALGDHEG
ncbi:MAG: Signal transduction histidine kinase [Nocardioides sp.]|uniref:sensor histidine kinase n=1 Tax=Nocardioides sp. TaxID=35761 RepID=UPI00261E82F8|nr:GAF domain-containing sensor histidine kinase [Nocardioides sp.]MCW2832281.1 Signal transduction histidine kinase [Nocardioides sp.]